MTRDEYLNADKLTDGAYDGRKGHDVHADYFAQFVNAWHTKIMLDRIGKERLLASRDVHLNDIPLNMWDDMPMTNYIIAKAKEYGDNASLSTKVCVYKQAARQWLAEHSEAKLFPVKYRYPSFADDPIIWLRSYAIGCDEQTALLNFTQVNSGTIGHEIEGC